MKGQRFHQFKQLYKRVEKSVIAVCRTNFMAVRKTRKLPGLVICLKSMGYLHI